MSRSDNHARRRVGQNIEDRIRRDDAAMRNQQFLKDYQTTRNIGEWHSHMEQVTAARSNQRINKEIMSELQLANLELKERRRAKLKELYDREQKEYELELWSKGMAFARHR
eukprot:TRINITY_DN6505_c0_g2_i5.p1 TRINITY_DN6505_c0_g2~~TRINITY_DN6505_c0_g2_i5.p1  ORF type:complete len:111 (-),score=30.86 TRINITY_DN6505_c0_g2_i5:179-511(-)